MVGFKEARKKAGLTMMEAGKRIGVSYAAIAQWESGYTMPTAKRLPKVARVYGCTVDELLRSENEEEL